VLIARSIVDRSRRQGEEWDIQIYERYSAMHIQHCVRTEVTGATTPTCAPQVHSTQNLTDQGITPEPQLSHSLSHTLQKMRSQNVGEKDSQFSPGVAWINDQSTSLGLCCCAMRCGGK